MARSRLHKRYVKNPYRPNPPLVTDILEQAIPGFASFAGTRFVTRVVATQVAKRAPSWGKHAGAVASVSSFLAAWFLAHRWKFTAKYHTPIVVGSFLATLQSLIQLYIPALGWMIADATPDLLVTGDQQIMAQDRQLAQLRMQPTDEDPNAFVYNDAYDAGRYAGSQGPGSMKIQTPLSPMGKENPPPQPDEQEMAIDDAIGAANLGVFAPN